LTVSVLKNNGNGTFQTPVAYSTGTNGNVRDVLLVDLDGDGQRDLVTANYYGMISLARGNGDGTFQAVSGNIFGVSSYYENYHLVSGDFNADGRPDLAIDRYGNNRAYVLLGKAGAFGSFQSLQDYAATGNPIGIAAGDFNEDGRTDFVTANYNG